MKQCNLVEDLLPVYIESLASPETECFITDHLKHCEACRRTHQRMSAPIQEADKPKVNIKKVIWRDILRLIYPLVLGVAIIIGLAVYLLWEIGEFSYTEYIPSPDGEMLVRIGDNSTAGFFDNEPGYLVSINNGRAVYADLEYDAYWAPDSRHLLTYSNSSWSGKKIIIRFYWADPETLKNSDCEQNEEKEHDALPILMEQCANRPEIEDYGTVEFEFMKWMDDSRTILFLFTTDGGQMGLLWYDCEDRVITNVMQ